MLSRDLQTLLLVVVSVLVVGCVAVLWNITINGYTGIIEGLKPEIMKLLGQILSK